MAKDSTKRTSRRGKPATSGESTPADTAREHREELEALASREPTSRKRKCKPPTEPGFAKPVNTAIDRHLPGPEFGGTDNKRTSLAEVYAEIGVTRENAKMIVQAIISSAAKGERGAIDQLERWRHEMAGDEDGDARAEEVVKAERALFELARKLTKAADRGEIEDAEGAEEPS